MAHTVTIGGDRLGSGKKMKETLRGYERSTFNQERDFKSTLAPGVLYPCFGEILNIGDHITIDVDTFVRTLPTKGPLFGSFKMQVDFFSCPFRLYQGVLHNNPIDIGMSMKDVLLPRIRLTHLSDKLIAGNTEYTNQITPTCLMKYLGMSGLGKIKADPSVPPLLRHTVKRDVFAIPVLAYYDIFKNYYSNKQEENAYVLSPDLEQEIREVSSIKTAKYTLDVGGIPTTAPKTATIESNNFTINTGTEEPVIWSDIDRIYIQMTGEYITKKGIQITTNLSEGGDFNGTLEQLEAIWGSTVNVGINLRKSNNSDVYQLIIGSEYMDAINAAATDQETSPTITIEGQTSEIYNTEILLKPFPLKNIDNMRTRILKNCEIGDRITIGGMDGVDEELPYLTLTEANNNSYRQNGLLVKTYQSDLFNNWLNTDWIEGDNGIGALSAIDVSGGTLTMDSLVVAQKVYNMLNRVALSGGTYEDWLEAVYDEKAVRKAESPMYMGGMSAEVMFEEVISSSETMLEGDFQALGSLGGKGTQVSKNGGNNIEIEAKEPTFIMGIISLTPRICYTQGNRWYMTDLNSTDDLHKPEMDGIGFQDLLVEQFAWWGTQMRNGGTPHVEYRESAGKVPAWINYQTAVDEAYGDFAEPEGKGFMVLARNYEMDEHGDVQDVTTYIDPAKFNYPFAYKELAAQNFWVQAHFNAITRRKMSAHQIPNL